jgi:Flp pilus assembly protein TadG
MRCSNRLPDRRGRERGSAAVEFLTLGVLLLVPLVYLVLTLSALQGASFAAEGAARQAARMYVLADSDAAGRAEVQDAVVEGLADWGIRSGAAAVRVTCEPAPGDCRTPRGSVSVEVDVAVALPLLPPALDVGAPGTILISSNAVQRMSMFAGTQ